MSINKKLMQITQRRDRDPRITKFHGRTYGGIEHPTCNRLDFATVGFDVDYSTSTALFNISNLDALSIQRVPTIVDFSLLPDMGRMNGTCV
jgi:hypothetical protein